MKYNVNVNGVEEIVDANDPFNALVGHSKVGFNAVSMAPKSLPGATQALALNGLKVKVVEYKEPVVELPKVVEPKKVVEPVKPVESVKVEPPKPIVDPPKTVTPSK